MHKNVFRLPSPLGFSLVVFISLGFFIASHASAVTRYADGQLSGNCTSGNYSIANRNCTGSDGNGYISLQTAVNASTGGDTVYVRGSATRYTGSAEGGSVTATGTSASNKLIIEGYQNENPLVFSFMGITFVHIKNLIVDPNNTMDSIGVMTVQWSRIENVEVRNAGIQGMLGLGNSEFINLNVHDNGFNPNPVDGCGGGCHGVYTGSDEGFTVNNLFDGGEFHHNAFFGIQCYSKCDNTIIRNLRVHHNGSVGLIVAFNPGIRVYNVVADHNGSNGVWIAGSSAVVYNITAYNNDDGGVCVDAPNVTTRNILAIGNAAGNNLFTNCNGTDYTSSWTSSNNITSGTASDYVVDAPNGDFHLKSSQYSGIGACDVSGPCPPNPEGVSTSPPPPPSPSTSTCQNLWNSSLPVTPSFGASFNLFSTAKELLMTAYCGVLGGISGAQMNVGNSSSYQYIYKTGYRWLNNAWSPFNYSGSSMDSGGNWFIGSANAQFALTSTELANKQSVLAYICEWNGSKWNCGCNNAVCATSYWNLQQFKQ